MNTTTLDHIADLIAALHRGDADRFARSLIRLESDLGPDDIADLIAAITAEEPPAFRPTSPTPSTAHCA